MMTETPRNEQVDVLEGDEGEPIVGRARDVGRAILLTSLADVKSTLRPVTLPEDATVAKAVETMRRKKVSAILVVGKRRPRRLVGIFTERDFVNRALVVRGLARMPLARAMTREPETLSPKDSVAYALEKMHVGRFRHVPVVDADGVPCGMISARDLIDFLCELCPEEILNLPPEPQYAVPREQEGP